MHEDRLNDATAMALRHVDSLSRGPAIDRDVEALVLDPCFLDSELSELAGRWPAPVEWHHGFRLTVAELREHRDYRGADVVAVGCGIAENDRIDASVIGRAVTRGTHDPQILKRLWHCVARFGRSVVDG